MAYVCICNAITESELKDEPSLVLSCGDTCGSCLDHDLVIELNSERKQREEINNDYKER